MDLQFYYVIADTKVAEYHIYATVLKSQVILLIMEGTERSETSYYSLS